MRNYVIKSAVVAKCITGLFASIVAENLQGNLLMLGVVPASQFDSQLNSVINSVQCCFIFGQTKSIRLPKTPKATSIEVEDAKGTARQRCYIRFNSPIAFALVVPKASTPTMPDSIAANSTVRGSSEVTRATVFIPVGFGTLIVGYYCL